jgi:3-oxoacyl-[acyl-carrier-protein] synthase-3
MGAQITNIAIHLPDCTVSNEQLEAEFEGWSSAKIEKKTGIRKRHVARDSETALTLAIKASEKVFHNYSKTKIDFLLYCTQSPEYYLPSGACILQDTLGLRSNIGALDYNLGCSGFIYGLVLAKSLLQSHVAKSVLLVTTETYTKHIHPGDKSNRTIFGDGAAATIIEESDVEAILNFSLGTDGSGHKNLIVPNGGMKNRYDPFAQEQCDKAGSIRTHNNLFMNGPEIFNFTIKAVPQVVSEVLLQNHLTMEEVDHVIFHQANKYMLEYLRKKLHIPKDKFYINLLSTGNTVSATIPIALKDCIERQIVKEDDKVLLVGFGVGYSWGGTIIRI